MCEYVGRGFEKLADFLQVRERKIKKPGNLLLSASQKGSTMLSGSKEPSGLLHCVMGDEGETKYPVRCQNRRDCTNEGSKLCVRLYCGQCCKEDESVRCPKHHLRRPLRPSKKEAKFSTSLQQQPPWVAFPAYGRYEMGWRMGGGQDYWCSFWTAFNALSPKEQKWYAQDFPEPAGWEGIYEFMTSPFEGNDGADAVLKHITGHM